MEVDAYVHVHVHAHTHAHAHVHVHARACACGMCIRWISACDIVYGLISVLVTTTLPSTASRG